MARTRLLIADDQPLMRAGFRAVLEANGFEVVAEAGDGLEAVASARATKPDVVLMDIQMPNLDGIEAMSELTDREREVLELLAQGMSSRRMDCARASANGRR